MEKEREADEIPSESDPLLLDDDKRKKEKKQTWKERIYNFWEFNTYVSGVIMACIVASSIAFCVQTMYVYKDYFFFVGLEIFFVSVFTIELSFRCWAFPGSSIDFWSTPMNIIDLVAVAPFFVELIFMMHDFDLRFLRALRLLRLFKFSRHSEQLNIIGSSMYLSISSFFLLGFMLLLAMVLLSTILQLIERGDKWDEKLECYTRYDGACSPFQSIPMTFWWAITTMTTVGYGDAYPITEWGKVVAAGTMVIGLLSIALPTTVLGVQFSDAYAQVTSQRQTNKLKLKMRPEKMQEEIEENVAAIQQVSRELDILLPDLKVLLQKVAKTNGNAHIDPVFAIFNDGAIQSVHKLVEFVNHAAH
eukprot:GEMP01045037.1.p1 GENE.GEMP01045037.1~~GEMP01045037.1.p1  ORF type:complete len:361 (+),score=64.47 GEMP01045037.1:471-1553(+)